MEGWRKLFNNICEYIFPVFCISCEKEGEWICDNCLVQKKFSGVFFCPVCHQPNEYGECCQNCKNNSSLSSTIAIGVYTDELLQTAIHTIKYHGADDIFSCLKKIMNIWFSQHKDLFANIEAIIPVPLYPVRFRERGFNQAEMIANIVGECLHKPVLLSLQRARATRQQALLSKEDRASNVDGAFVCLDNMQNKTCLLADDVYTTGSTMQACAKALLLSGAKQVIGFTVARG